MNAPAFVAVPPLAPAPPMEPPMAGKNMLDGAQVIVDYLIREKVPYAFGLCGHGNIQFIDALYGRANEIKTISVHHETVAGFMADVYYRVSGQPTATFTSCGPGSANLPIALGNSFLDSVPFLAVTGNIPTSQFNRGAFQELYRHYQADFPSTVRAYCKRCKPRRPDSLIGSMGFGPMGFGVAGVLGAKLAAPDRPCVSVCGDGAFFMHASVLGTAVEYDIPVVWVVWNNYAYASIRGLQRGYLGGRELATDFRHPDTGLPYNPDFAAMARSAGIEGVRIDRAGDLGDAVRRGIATGRPYLIDAQISADRNPGGAGVWELPGLGQSQPAIGGRYTPN
jgi:thiamine pyrophosphate-dependent acetolactate synthase large subunit-like protein